MAVLPFASAQNIGINVQNTSAGANASTDVVATANNGTPTTNYVDLGINSSVYSGGVMGLANDAHLFNVGQNLLIGTGSASKSLIFLTGGTVLTTHERFRIDGNGNVGVGMDAPLYKLDVNGTIRTGRPSVTNGSLVFSNSNNANTVTVNSAATSASYALTLPSTQGAASSVLTNNGSGSLTWSGVSGAADWSKLGNSGITASEFLGTIDDKVLIFKSNNQSFLEFGRRQTLGLQDVSGQVEFVDYQDGSEKVTYVRSALQFEAAAAQFYKPKMWTDIDGNFRVKGSSAGTDYFEFGSTGSTNNGGFNFIIGDDGDEPMVFGSYDYNGPLNNGTPTTSEIMRLQSGRMAVGSNAFDGTNPEKLLIDAGTTTSYNLMTGKGSIDNYLQINVKNLSAGGSASSDIVASSNLGNESSNFIDLGINSSGYTNTSLPVLGGAQTAYLYATGNDFVIGNATATRPLRFFTGGTAVANERVRIDGTGNVGIGTTTPAYKLEVNGTAAKSGGGTWSTASDKRLKKEIKPFTDGLEVLAKINPVWFQYNGMAGMPNDGQNFVGIIAQEMKKIAPYTIGSFRDEETNVDYLNYDANAVTYILINAVKEQQLIIDATKEQLQEQNQKQSRIIDEMKKQLEEQSQRLLRLEEKK